MQITHTFSNLKYQTCYELDASVDTFVDWEPVKHSICVATNITDSHRDVLRECC